MKKIYALLLLLLLICSVGRADVLQLKDGVYIIKEGDCLWNISKKYYDNPYLWPKIWEANPYITNPDLIFPDDQLVIPGIDAAAEEVETEMNETIVETPVEEEVPIKEETPVVVEPIKVEEETEVVVEDEVPYEDEAFEEELPEEEVIKDLEIPISFDNQVLAAGGVVQAGELPEQGYIVDFEETFQEYHGAHELIFLNFYEDVAIGDAFLIYTYFDEVKDPSTKSALGKKFVIKGVVTIVEMGEYAIKGEVKKSFDKLEKGDLLMAYDPERWVYMDLGGTPEYTEGVIAGSKELGAMLGHRQDVVYINLGSTSGIQAGQKFYVYKDSKRISDPMGGTATTGELEIGQLKIIKTFEYSSSAVVTQVSELIEVGDIVRFTE